MSLPQSTAYHFKTNTLQPHDVFLLGYFIRVIIVPLCISALEKLDQTVSNVNVCTEIFVISHLSVFYVLSS